LYWNAADGADRDELVVLRPVYAGGRRTSPYSWRIASIGVLRNTSRLAESPTPALSSAMAAASPSKGRGSTAKGTSKRNPASAQPAAMARPIPATTAKAPNITY